jgi:hypothetical protein
MMKHDGAITLPGNARYQRGYKMALETHAPFQYHRGPCTT